MLRILAKIRTSFVKPLRILAAVLLLAAFSSLWGGVFGTVAVSSDTEKSENNVLIAGTWGEEDASDLKPGDVVINEMMWMGSEGDSDDEWIELRNTTDRKIDLSNWNVVHGGSGAGGHIEIPDGYSIKANGYFLLTRKKWDETAINLSADLEKDEGYTHIAGMNLHNEGEQLVLENNNEIVIDTAWIETDPQTDWPAGSNGTQKKSMQRIDSPGDGTQASSWQTCTNAICNDLLFWDVDDGDNYGTPNDMNM